MLIMVISVWLRLGCRRPADGPDTNHRIQVSFLTLEGLRHLALP